MFVLDQLKKSDPRLRVLTLGVVTGLLILLTGLWWVQIISSRRYVENQVAQSFRTVRTPAIRGKILDRKGRALAENRPSYNVCVYLNELRDQFKNTYYEEILPEYRSTHSLGPTDKIPRDVRAVLEREARYRTVSNIVQRLSLRFQQPSELTPKDFHRHYQTTRALPLPVFRNLDITNLARFQEQPNPSPGVDLEIEPTRTYGLGTTNAHLLGYLMRDNASTEGEEAFVNYRLPDYSGQRTVGIERVFDEQLRGKGGVKSVLVNSLGYRQSENVWTPAEPGDNVVLTIDAEVQAAVESHLQSAGPNVRGAVVVLDPNSGDIIAMASAPVFNPNDFIPKIRSEDWRKLMNKDQRPMINRALQENYPPGSIFKIVSGLALLEAGVNPKAKMYNPGHIYVGRRSINDLVSPGLYDFQRAFAKSSNVYFISNALAIGPERIVRLGKKFKLGETNGIPTSQEVSGHFPTLEQLRRGWLRGDTANLSIGQGPIDVTPLQVAIMVAAVANGGTVYRARLVSRIEPQEPSKHRRPILFPSGKVRDSLDVRPESLRILREAMLADVEDSEGTGGNAAVPGIRVCGKTGTAEVQDHRGGAIDQITWFASYAPYEKPQFVVVVMIESGFSGGTTCAPVAQKVYRSLQELNLLPKPDNPAMVLKR